MRMGDKMNSRDQLGRFISGSNIFEVKDGLIYCYTEKNELLFFTDDTRVLDHIWGKAAKGYSSSRIDGDMVLAHRFISRPNANELVDHINRNKKDNRTTNLRNTDKSVNAFNCDIRRNNTSGKTGVYYRKDTHKWTAEIKKNYKKINLGSYQTYEEAVRAREEAEVKLYGDKQ